MAKDEALFAQLFDLLGKRSDDPAIVAFHRERKLAAPPVAGKVDLAYDVPAKKLGFAMFYGAKVQAPRFYPPRRENGKLVTYLTVVDFEGEFGGVLPGGIPLALAEDDAKARACAPAEINEYIRRYPLVQGGTWGGPLAARELSAIYDVDDDALRNFQMRIVELEDDDPALAALAAQAPKETRPARVFPKPSGTPTAAPLPASLEDLRALQGADGLGELDFEMLTQIETGGPKAWTGNADAEHELRVFAHDGTGGLVAFWLVVAGQPLEAQPIVFLGSEGTVGPVAKDLPDFFALLSSGLGPYEVVENGAIEADAPLPSVKKLGDKHFGKRKKRSAGDIVADASAAYGDIEDRIKALNKQGT